MHYFPYQGGHRQVDRYTCSISHHQLHSHTSHNPFDTPVRYQQIDTEYIVSMLVAVAVDANPLIFRKLFTL